MYLLKFTIQACGIRLLDISKTSTSDQEPQKKVQPSLNPRAVTNLRNDGLDVSQSNTHSHFKIMLLDVVIRSCLAKGFDFEDNLGAIAVVVCVTVVKRAEIRLSIQTSFL